MAANRRLGVTCRDHVELKNHLVEQMKSGTIITGPTSVEFVMRTMHEAISEDDGQLGAAVAPDPPIAVAQGSTKAPKKQ